MFHGSQLLPALRGVEAALLHLQFHPEYAAGVLKNHWEEHTTRYTTHCKII